MLKWIIPVCLIAAGLLTSGAGSGVDAAETLDGPRVWQAKLFGCKVIDGQLVCGKNGNGNGTANQGSGGKKNTKGVGDQGERSCPPGYVVLKEKNKYGAFCEPREGLPPPAQAEAEKCQFGMIGTPPNDCACPAGTDFQGYKGCVKVQNICCTAVIGEGGSSSGCTDGPPARTEAQLREALLQSRINGVAPSSISCSPAN